MKLLTDACLLAAKDLRVYVRDRSALCLGFLVPIALVTVFGWIMTYAFGGSSGMPKVEMWIVDEDQSPRSTSIVKSLRESEMLKVRPRENEAAISQDKLHQMVQDGDVHHGLILPKGFGDESLDDENAVNMKMLRDPGRSMEDRMIQIALMQSTFADGNGGAWKRSMKKMFRDQGMDSKLLGDLDSAMGSMQSTIGSFLSTNEEDESQVAPTQHASETASSTSTSPMDFMTNMVSLDTEDIRPPSRSKQVTYQQAQSVAGMSVMMLLFGLTGAGSLLIGEREFGTLKRLFSLPIARESVLLGKWLFVISIGIAQMIVLFVYGELMFHVGLFRDPLTLGAIIVTWVSAASCFGMFIATFSKSAKQADSLATILILIMAALGGCWFPLQMMSLPLPMEIATKSMMTYWAMEGLQGMLWNGLGIADTKIQFALLVQWCWTLVLAGLSLYFFRKNYIQR